MKKSMAPINPNIVIGTPNDPMNPLSSSNLYFRISMSFPYTRYSSYTISFFDQPFFTRVFTIFFYSYATCDSESYIARVFSVDDASLIHSNTSFMMFSWDWDIIYYFWRNFVLALLPSATASGSIYLFFIIIFRLRP